MTILKQGNYLGDWLREEFAAPNYCREEIVIATAPDRTLQSGTVLGKITASGKYAPYNNDVDPQDGTETAAAILIGDVDASAADAKAVALVRGPAVVSKAGLTWSAENEADDIVAGLAELRTLNIIVREGV